MKEESQSRRIQGYSLTVKLNSQKLSIRALQDGTSDLYICEYPHGHIPQDISFFYQNEEEFFDALVGEEEVRVREGNLILPYTTFKRNRPVKREFILPLTKIEANEIEVLRRKVSKLEVQNERIPQMQQQINKLLRMVEHLETRTCFYSYNPGIFRKLALSAENNQLYKINGNYLTRRAPKINPSEMIEVSLISNQPIGEEHLRFSYKIRIHDVPDPQVRVFIGLCMETPKGVFANNPNKKFTFIVQRQPSNELQKRIILIGGNKDNTCLHYSLQKYPQLTFLKKDDTFVMTVDLENSHITWFRNEISIERSYFQNPHTNIYPFVFLQPYVEVQL